MLSNPAVVPSVTETACGLPTDSPTRFSPLPGGSSISQLQLSSSTQPTTVGHKEGLRHQFRAETIPEKAINLILASWREKTNTIVWCASQNTNPFSANIADILLFLIQDGRAYRSLNCYRSVISSTHHLHPKYAKMQQAGVNELLSLKALSATLASIGAGA